jgi:hypothetical protein
MTTTDRVHDQGFCYDGDVPPSIPPGKPLRERGTPHERRPAQSTLRRKLASLRGRIGR